MKITSWNVQGLGNTRTFEELKEILKKHRSQILFLYEMKLMSGQMVNMGKKLVLITVWL